MQRTAGTRASATTTSSELSLPGRSGVAVDRISQPLAEIAPLLSHVQFAPWSGSTCAVRKGASSLRARSTAFDVDALARLPAMCTRGPVGVKSYRSED
eukprot:scaffold74831_cov67-Phaeocystis_antarctica.AAC.4